MTEAPAVRRPWWQVALVAQALPVAFVLVTWANAQIDLLWLVRPVVVVVVGTALGTLILASIVRDPDRVVVASAVIGIGLVLDSFASSLLMVVLGGLLVVEGIVNRRPWRFAGPLARLWSAFSVALVVVAIVTMVGNGSLPAAIDALRLDLEKPKPAQAWDPEARDIWVILLDGYPGEAAAASAAPDWDREAFPNALGERGFDVQRNSRTNYLLTRLILPAMFDTTHVRDVLPPTAGSNLATRSRILRAVLEDGVTLEVLAEAGYERIAISSGWAEVGPRRVDRVIDPPQLTEVEVILLRASGLGEIVGAIAPDTYSQQIRERIGTTYAEAARLAGEPHDRPRFSFVHVPAPHPPVVIDADGSPINGTPSASISRAIEPALDRAERVRRQFGEVDYIAARTLELIDVIDAESVRPPVILVFSDHGTDIDWDPNDPLAGGLDERTSNLIALRSPDHPDLLPDGTTLINVLPHILREYVGADLPLQPDTLWSWRSGADILDLVEIDPTTWTAK